MTTPQTQSDISEKSSITGVVHETQPIVEASPEEVKRLLRRLDTRLVVFVLWSYCIMRIDVGSINNAGIMNFEQKGSIRQQLGLTPQQWTWVIASFSYTYMAFEPVSTFCVKIYTPSSWVARISITWGIIMCCTAAVTSYGGLITTRVLLGAAEAGYFPVIVYHWSFWYSPQQLAPRLLALYMAGAAAGGVSGFLAYAISFAHTEKMAGWQWLFIIEGLIPIANGVATLWIIPDFPSTSKWLSAREVNVISQWLHKDAPREESKTWSGREALNIFKDPTYIFFTTFWIIQGIAGYGISLVLPQVIKDLGFTSSAGANLLNIPVAAVSIVNMLFASWLLQGKRINAFNLVIINDLIVIVGYIILLYVRAPGVRYFALLLLTAAAGIVYPALWPRRVQALRGTAGAALGIGLHNASAQVSGLVAPQLYRIDYGPRYIKPITAAAVMIGGNILILLPLFWMMDGDISKYPWLVKRVQAQTHHREGDDGPKLILTEEQLAYKIENKKRGLFSRKPKDVEAGVH